MGRIAVTEDVEGIRDEQDIGDEGDQLVSDNDAMELGADQPNADTVMPKTKGKYVATGREVQEAFDSVNTLRYTQPTHLQGTLPFCCTFLH
jgi:cleavage and polyadenylation specificity factor subunit 2